MAETRTIARPYAEAVFKVARNKNDLASWAAMLGLAASMASDVQIRALIGDPNVPSKRLGELLIAICGDRLNDEGRNFILLLAENGRIEILPEVYEMFDQLKARHEGVMEAKVISAFPLDDTQLRNLLTDLEAKFQRRIEAKVSVDPELIGGVKVEIGDEVLDASVRGKLEAMAVALKS